MLALAPNSSTSLWAKVRIISAWANWLITLAVSAMLSPRPIWRSSPRKNIGVPPRWATALSDARRVLVDGLDI